MLKKRIKESKEYKAFTESLSQFKSIDRQSLGNVISILGMGQMFYGFLQYYTLVSEVFIPPVFQEVPEGNFLIGFLIGMAGWLLSYFGDNKKKPEDVEETEAE